MATSRYASPYINHNLFICVLVSLVLPMANEGAPKIYEDKRSFPNDGGKRLTREYHLKQGAIRGLIVKPGDRQHYDLQLVEMFLGIPYAAAPTGIFRFMPPASASSWSDVKMATHFAPVCPQTFPTVKKVDPPSLGRQNYMKRLKTFLKNESEDCLYLNVYVPYREQKTKKFPVLVFIHGDSFEWSSGNPYDGRVLASYGNIMVITVNYRLGILGFLKPSLTEHVYGNNGLFDQLAALQWIKENIEDLNGDPDSVTVMGHGTGAACVSYLMLSPIPEALFHRAILMSGSALSDWALTKDPAQYTLQVAQSLGCRPSAAASRPRSRTDPLTDHVMTCLQKKPLSEIKKVQILSREFETPLGPVVTGSFIPSEPSITMDSYPDLLSKYQLLSGVTELESYHDFGAIELSHGIIENDRDDIIKKYLKIAFEGAGDKELKEILKQYAPGKLHPQQWSVENNRDVILAALSDARGSAPAVHFANYHASANREAYFYVFGHNSVSTEYAHLNKSVHGEEMPYILGVPLGGTNTHFHSEYTPQEKLLSEVMMRLWTNFVKIGSPNTQSENKYFTLDRKHWSLYNVEWPEYDVENQPYLRLDIPPSVSSLYRSNYTNFWIQTLPKRLRNVNPLFEYAPVLTTQKPKPTHKPPGPVRKTETSYKAPTFFVQSPHYSSSSDYGRVVSQSFPDPAPYNTHTDIFNEIKHIKNVPRLSATTTTAKPKPLSMPVKTSSATVTLIISLGVLFLVVNIGICSILYFKKRKLRVREQVIQNNRNPRADIGEVDVIGQKSSKDDKTALKTLKNGCSVIKSMSFDKMRNNNKKVKKKSEQCKTPKSDDSGGFRERFQLRRHLSTSTLDAHTKVRDWIANEVMHRCSPGILRKSNLDLHEKNIAVAKPFTRSEELLSDSNKINKDTKTSDVSSKHLVPKNYNANKTKTSEKTTSTSALGSHSSIGSNKQSLSSIKQTSKSSDSLRSKATESVKSKKVSVAIDATPAARTNSILNQEPIEISRSFDHGDQKHSSTDDKLQRSNTDGDFYQTIKDVKPVEHDGKNKIYTNVVTLSLSQDKPLQISHKHSKSDPVTDVNYDKLMKEKMEYSQPVIDILPPVTFRNDVNVTSRDETAPNNALTVEEALLTIKKRNFPKVLPDLPKSQKRLSLQPTALQTFRGYCGSIENQFERPRMPPQPPPRTSTLERRLAYKNTKPLSSFDTSNIKKISETESFVSNYENIDSLSPYSDTNVLWKKSLEKNPNNIESPEPTIIIAPKEREYPKVIIASSGGPAASESQIVIKPASNVQLPAVVPRIRLPDDFHSQTTGSVTSFSSFCSDEDDDLDEDMLDDIAEDKLIKELVGGVESPTNLDDLLDSKGPETVFEKKLEIVPVKINLAKPSKSTEDYVSISDLLLPDVSGLERTAQIKPNFGLNKLQNRTECIHKPPEKAVKVKQRRSMNPSSLLNKSLRSSKKSSDRNVNDGSKLEHSTSGSSNDTESSTGTVKKIDLKKD